MPRWSRWLADRLGGVADAERGSAALEFLAAGVILLVPLVYLAVALSSIQAGSLAAEGAARHAARVYVLAGTPDDARAASGRAVDVALEDYGLSAAQASVELNCRDQGNGCLVRRNTVTVTVRLRVPLPLVPDLLDARRTISIPVSSSATATVSRFWGASR